MIVRDLLLFFGVTTPPKRQDSLFPSDANADVSWTICFHRCPGLPRMLSLPRLLHLPVPPATACPFATATHAHLLLLRMLLHLRVLARLLLLPMLLCLRGPPPPPPALSLPTTANENTCNMKHSLQITSETGETYV
jgi:hypothetical protein